MLNDFDIKNLQFDKETLAKYEKLSLDNAIAQMDDMGWCPIPSCAQIAHIEKELNQGRCTFCDFTFCLDCKERVHPFKRCSINRLDLMASFKDKPEIDAM